MCGSSKRPEGSRRGPRPHPHVAGLLAEALDPTEAPVVGGCVPFGMPSNCACIASTTTVSSIAGWSLHAQLPSCQEFFSAGWSQKKFGSAKWNPRHRLGRKGTGHNSSPWKAFKLAWPTRLELAQAMPSGSLEIRFLVHPLNRSGTATDYAERGDRSAVYIRCGLLCGIAQASPPPLVRRRALHG
jgi:hypothetical protein